MMMFTPAEISDLLGSRMVLKGSNKTVTEAIKSNGSRNNTSDKSNEGIGENKLKKGLLSMFNRAKNTQQS